MKYEQHLRSFTKTLLIIEAIGDIFTLIYPGLRVMIMWSFQIDIIDFNYYFRIIIEYVTSSLNDNSTWILCALSIDRMCLILWPTNAMIKRLSYKEACIVPVIIFVCSSIVNINQFFHTKQNYIIQSYFLMVYQIILPFLVMTLSSIIILYKLRLYSKQVQPNTNIRMLQSSKFAVKMVLVVALYYGITGLFSCFINIMWLNGNKGIVYFTLRNIAALIVMSNSAFKFYLYNLSTPHMRKEVGRLFHLAKNEVIKKTKKIFH